MQVMVPSGQGVANGDGKLRPPTCSASAGWIGFNCAVGISLSTAKGRSYAWLLDLLRPSGAIGKMTHHIRIFNHVVMMQYKPC
jgi:hypothetical protein